MTLFFATTFSMVRRYNVRIAKRIESWAPNPRSSMANSGKGQKISRCPRCRIALWSNYGGAGDAIHFVRVGTLDEPHRFPPDIHIFTASKQPWIVLPADIPAVKEYYKASELWPKESLERRAVLLARSQPQ